MKRVLLIVNLQAARTGARGVEAVTATLAADGCEISVAYTEGPGHAAELARGAARGGADVVAVYGGDGTVMQAVEGLHGSGAALGVIPGGTGNLLAGNLRIPRRPAAAARVVTRGAPRTIDLGRLENRSGSRCFAVACGAGYDADMVANTRRAAKRRWGILAYIAYVLRTAHHIRALPFRVTADGAVHELEAASVLVANCGEAIPRLLSLGHGITLDDGMLDVVAIKAAGFRDVVVVMAQLLWRRDTDRVRHIRARAIEVEATDSRVVQADGEICGTTPFTVEVVPAALTVMAPAG